MRFSNLLPVALLLMVFSSTSQAIELDCTTSFGAALPEITGYTLPVKDNETGVAEGALQISCPVCRLPKPEKINFVHIVRNILVPKEPGISKTVYLSDKGVVLTVEYASMLPARIAKASLVNSELNNGDPVKFDCKF